MLYISAPIQKELIIYADSRGRQPFIMWLESLDMSVKHRVQQRIIRLSSGNYGDYKFLDQGVYELRLDFGPGYRIYFGESGNKIVVLLTGGNKRTQKKDIDKAIQYWSSYKEDKND